LVGLGVLLYIGLCIWFRMVLLFVVMFIGILVVGFSIIVFGFVFEFISVLLIGRNRLLLILVGSRLWNRICVGLFLLVTIVGVFNDGGNGGGYGFEG